MVDWKKGRLAHVLTRLIYGHLLSYPLAFAFAMAVIPFGIVYVVDHTKPPPDPDNVDKIVQLVLRAIAWPVIGVFALEHVLAVPWAIARNEQRYKRVFWIGTSAIGAVTILFGGGSWVWLLTR